MMTDAAPHLTTVKLPADKVKSRHYELTEADSPGMEAQVPYGH